MGISYPKQASDINSNNLNQETSEGLGEIESLLGLDSDLEDLINAAIFTNQENFESSYVSKPYFTFDMGEPKHARARFVYNYFQKNERLNIENLKDNTFFKGDDLNTSDIIYQSRTEKSPKFVRLSIAGPTNVEYENASKAVWNLGNNEDIINAINVEASNSTPFFTGFELYDVDIEGDVYKKLKDNAYSIFGNSTFLSNTVPSDAINQIAEVNEPTTIFNTNSKEFIKSLMNVKNSGLAIAPSDVKPENVELFKRQRLFSSLNFSIKCSNLFFKDIYKRSTRTSNSVFNSENRGILPIAVSKTDYLTSQLGNRLGSEILSLEFDPEVDSIEQLDSSFTFKGNTNYSIKHIGYLILKQETQNDGSFINFDPILKITNKNGVTIIDENVRYGGFYTYIVRSVYEVIAPAYDPNDGETYNYEKFLLASEGIPTTVNCVETTAPPPPAAIRGGIEFKHRVPRITWQFPVNPQRDIKRFQVFKRESVDLPFTLLAEYNFDDSLIKTDTTEIAQPKNLYNLDFPKLSFIDYKYKNNSSPIYAIASVDAHGLSSNLSTQISVKYNRYLNKAEVKMISREGAPKAYPNIYIEEDTFLDAIKVSNMDRMTVFFDPEYFVVKKDIEQNESAADKQKNRIDLNLIAANPNKATYKIQVVNLDMAKSKNINIKIADKHNNSLDNVQKVSAFNEENLSFT